jgi:glycosyltransferase involved in cell wall biosynthesis
MIVIPNGIDPNRFYSDQTERDQVRAEWGVRSGEKLIGLVARLDPVKDHSTFIKAAAILSDVEENLRFVCVGNGSEEYKGRLRALAKDLNIDDRFTWQDFRVNARSVYNALDLACSCSIGEGFSNAVAEAMACGVPCTVTHAGDSAWIVGDTGVVVTPGNPEEVSKGMSALLSAGGKDSTAVRDRIIREFGIDRMIRRTEALLSG